MHVAVREERAGGIRLAGVAREKSGRHPSGWSINDPVIKDMCFQTQEFRAQFDVCQAGRDPDKPVLRDPNEGGLLYVLRG